VEEMPADLRDIYNAAGAVPDLDDQGDDDEILIRQIREKI
jgi:hypothetical protein